ncbi:hypothetical protein B9J93_03005 [Vibrio sp. V17_P4S1T151]|uniref:hypothetical protein n=1 Tax=unclassified Vibrio TaxID=2614977 RepID=UPI000B8E5BBB|nr:MULTISPECIES: hypothetical protein [unclassified Vibrio]OXX49212.1 hypothetical protein B9J93_03005 [Vibrio sp. V17_P4S1T151]OXX65226.1 hypothetical protein B9J89_04870 [Vibrio sp. V15_P4S5T153]
MNATHIEINEVSWTCAKCGHENKDLIKETNEPLCGGCDQVFDWNQINIDVTTFIGGEETYVNLSELCLIEEKLINELEEVILPALIGRGFTAELLTKLSKTASKKADLSAFLY